MVDLSYYAFLNLLALALQLFLSSMLGLLVMLLMLGAYLYFGVSYRPSALPPADLVAPATAPAHPGPEGEGGAPPLRPEAGMV